MMNGQIPRRLFKATKIRGKRWHVPPTASSPIRVDDDAIVDPDVSCALELFGRTSRLFLKCNTLL